MPFTLEIHDGDPGFQMAEWDHIVEASIRIPSGRVEVHECTGGSHANLSVEFGTYRIRAHYKSLDSIAEDQLDGKDSYMVSLWLGDETPFRVVKSHPKTA